jgi:cytoskeletal protein CcmA (bactofilin family)
MQFKNTILLLSALFIGQAHAIDFIATNSYLVAEDQTVLDEQCVAAGMALTEGTFKNDLFITSGNQLTLNGTYEGNVWGSSGGSITMGGACKRNIRVAGKAVRIEGSVTGNILAMAETVIIATNAAVEGNITLIGTSIIQEGAINGQATIYAGRVTTLGGTIGGNVKVVSPDILFTSDAQLNGDLTYLSNKELLPDEGVVSGKIERNIPRERPLFSSAHLVSRGLWFLAALMAGIPFIALFPLTTAMASQLARTTPWKCLLVGFLASGALPIFGIMCISSIIGVPLGALILAMWGVLAYLSRIVVGLLIGTLILRSTKTSISHILLAMTLGLALIYLASLFPAISMPVQLAVVWIGMGALLLALLRKRRLIIQMPQNLKEYEALKEEEQNQPKEDSP